MLKNKQWLTAMALVLFASLTSFMGNNFADVEQYALIKGALIFDAQTDVESLANTVNMLKGSHHHD